MRKLWGLALFGLLLLGCQSPKHKPTEAFESPQVQSASTQEQAEDFKIGWLIVDARAPFEYSLSHIPGSINIEWHEFTQKKDPYRGVFEQDLYAHTRRLSRYGVDSKTPVVVVGDPRKNMAEMGRLAWTLEYFGLEKVRTLGIDEFDFPLTREQSRGYESKAPWKPILREEMLISREELIDIVTKRIKYPNTFILDVRSESEYLGKVSDRVGKRLPDVGAMNIPLSEFYDNSGRPDKELIQKLYAVGISKNSQLIVVSNKGLRSGAAAYSLRRLGFKNVKNFSGWHSFF